MGFRELIAGKFYEKLSRYFTVTI